MNTELMKAIENRRTIYTIGEGETVAKSEVEAMVAHAVKHCPSAFNMQSSRVALLFGDEHKALWDIVMQQLLPVLKPGQDENTRKKIDGFKAGWGTILYFDDAESVAGFVRQYPAYAGNFTVWAQQANGMLQHACWTLLSEAGLGCSLQHYNPLIDEAVRARFGIPAFWSLIAQMPFGSREAEAGPKDFLPVEERLVVFGK